jgi:hypothetical protein
LEVSRQNNREEQKRITEGNKINRGHQSSRQEKGKMARKEDEWTIAM